MIVGSAKSCSDRSGGLFCGTSDSIFHDGTSAALRFSRMKMSAKLLRCGTIFCSQTARIPPPPNLLLARLCSSTYSAEGVERLDPKTRQFSELPKWVNENVERLRCVCV